MVRVLVKSTCFVYARVLWIGWSKGCAKRLKWGVTGYEVVYCGDRSVRALILPRVIYKSHSRKYVHCMYGCYTNYVVFPMGWDRPFRSSDCWVGPCISAETPPLNIDLETLKNTHASYAFDLEMKPGELIRSSHNEQAARTSNMLAAFLTLCLPFHRFCLCSCFFSFPPDIPINMSS
jgi:hypothetical protein